VFDPNETNNLAGDAAHNDVLANMRARLETWQMETEDPILSGPFLPQEGTVVNNPDDRDSNDPLYSARDFLGFA